MDYMQIAKCRDDMYVKICKKNIVLKTNAEQVYSE